MAISGGKRQKKLLCEGQTRDSKYKVGAQVAPRPLLSATIANFRLDLAHKIIVFPNPGAYTETPLQELCGKRGVGSRRTP
jgi:hypothetical protein